MKMIEERRRNRGQGGFTLIELLVVIAILAILAGVAVFAVNGLTDNADENACSLEKETFIVANQAAIAAGSPNVSDHLDSGTVDVVGGNVEGKYWQMPNAAANPNEPVGFDANAGNAICD
jgi:prepilin-type N-terminal cleavage/methylation domain-containing protein